MKRLILSAIVMMLALAMVACGGSSDAETAPEPITINVTGNDAFVFEPASLTVKSGQEVRLTFENEGALQHSWVLVPERVEAIAATDADAVRGINSGLVDGGEANTITFVAPAPGTYQIVCTVAGHAAGGMVGELTVEP